MSSPLRIELLPSPALAAALLGLAVLAALALLLSAAPAWSLAVVPVLLAWAWPRAPQHAGRELVLHDDGSAVLLTAQGDDAGAPVVRLQRRGWLTVLTLQLRGRAQAHFFTPGTLRADDARRLGLWFERHVQHASNAPVIPNV